MILLNDNFSDGPRAPTQVIVHGDAGTLTREQLTNIRQVYKEFQTAVKTSPATFFTKEIKLADGTVVRLESNNGQDRVMVWPAGGEEEVQAVWGIGICVVADLAGTLFDGYKVETEYGWRPQPLVLTPKGVVNPTTGKYESTGEWKVKKVKALLGGNKLWVASSKRYWVSWFSPNYLQDSVLYTENVAIYQTQPNVRISERPVQNWTPLSRLNYYFDYTAGKYEAYSGNLMFRGNDTYRLFNNKYIQNYSFVCQHETGTKLYALYAQDNATIKLYSGRARAKQGLARPSAALTGAYVSVLEHTFVPPAGFYFLPTSITVCNDGKKALCLLHGTGTESNAVYDNYAEFSFDPDYSVSFYSSGLTENHVPENVAYSGAATSAITNESFFRLYDSPVQTSCANVPAEMVPVFLPVEPKLEGRKGRTSTYSSLGRSYIRQANSSMLERVTYDEDGDKVFDWAESIDEMQYTGYETANWYQTPNPNAGGSDIYVLVSPVFTYDAERHASWVQTKHDILHLGAIEFKRQVWDFDITETATMTASFGTDLILRHNKALTATGVFSYEERQLIFYEQKFSLVVYVERVIKYTEVSCSGASTYTSAPDSYTFNPSIPAGTVNAPDTNTLALVVELGGVEVYRFDLPAETVTPTWYTAISGYDATRYHPYEGAATHKSSFTDYPVGTTTSGSDTRVVTSTPKTYSFSGWVLSPCPDGSYSDLHYVPQAQTYNYADIGVTTTLHAENVAEVLCPLEISRTARYPDRYMHVQYARDPITLAVAINLTFQRSAYDGGADKSWFWLVDDTGFKSLADVLDLPEGAEPMVWRDGSLNSIVSI